MNKDKDKNIDPLDIKLLSIEEMMNKFMVSKATIYKWMRYDGFPSIKLGGIVRFDPQEVDKWVDSNRRNKNG